MTGQRRELLLRVMAGNKKLLPFLYLVNEHRAATFLLSDLLKRGLVGDALDAFIERDHGGDVHAAAFALGHRAHDLVVRAL